MSLGTEVGVAVAVAVAVGVPVAVGVAVGVDSVLMEILEESNKLWNLHSSLLRETSSPTHLYF